MASQIRARTLTSYGGETKPHNTALPKTFKKFVPLKWLTQCADISTLQAIAELRALYGEDTISTDDEDLLAHGFSEWSSINIVQLPVAVAYPKSTEEVSQIAKICHKYRMPMIPYSGGSSLEANFSAPHGGMSVDFAYMDQIVALHEDDLDVVVQPSVQWMQLNDAIKHTGLFFPVDPGPSAKIGGMVGTSCSGTNACRYGTMKEWVVNLTVVLADGTIIKTKRRPRKSSAGTTSQVYSWGLRYPWPGDRSHPQACSNTTRNHCGGGNIPYHS